MTVVIKLDAPPTRDGLELMERGNVAGGATHVTKHISDGHEFHGDQLVAEAVDENNGVRAYQRRLYAVDTANVLYLFSVACAGPEDKLAECKQAQQSMVLILPDQAPLDMTIVTPKQNRNRAYLIGQIVGGVLVLVLVIWYVVRRR